MARLLNKVATGVVWSLSEKAGSTLLQMAVSIIVARLLVPEDFGVMAIMTFFTAIATAITDSGFSQALIRAQSPSERDYKSVFVFNIIVSLLLYALFTAAAYPLSIFYRQPVIWQMAPALFLLLPLNALCVIQNTVFTRQFRFATISKITFAASLAGGAAAVVMALSGCGVWSLVGQRLATMASRAALLWIAGSWRPKRGFDMQPLRTMAPFSLRLLATDLITAVYNNIAQLFIGKIYSTDTLGYFNQGQKLKDVPVNATMQAVQSVTYPALSSIKDEGEKLRESFRQVVMMTAYAIFPVMAGLITVADDMFSLLLGAKWMATVPYFRILALMGLFQPLSSIAANMLKVRSDGRIIVRLEILKKGIMTIILAATIPVSAQAVAWGMAAVSAVEFVVNMAAAKHYGGISLAVCLRTLLPVAAVSALMAAGVYYTGAMIGGVNTALRLAIEIVEGAALYALFSYSFSLESWHVAKRTLREMLRHQ